MYMRSLFTDLDLEIQRSSSWLFRRGLFGTMQTIVGNDEPDDALRHTVVPCQRTSWLLG
jgi:hypothetical protein